ncbi:MAG: DUF4236 domain-containing protein [Pseudomonadota bacterium]|nr:DUF4236 domain-containing protein [Pseudomonadota bacterium]
MSFYIRKSVRVGPLRFNLSKSGVGVSAGIKGFRVGSGPRGNYVHMGMGGLYYRTSLSPNSNARPINRPKPAFDDTQRVGIYSGTHDPLQEIESGSIDDMVDSSSQDLVEELNDKRRKVHFWPFAGVSTLVALTISISQDAPSWAVYGVAAIGTLLTAIAYYRDLLKKTVVVLYDIESDFGDIVEQLHAAFNVMKDCKSA